MHRISTPTMSDMKQNADRRSLRRSPRRLTIECIRQFARSYQPALIVPAPLADIVLN